MRKMKENKTMRIGTRGSRLALVQADHVRERIAAMYPGTRTEVVIIKTTADRIQSKPLYGIGGKALFLRELEEALINKQIDIAVHSMKDVPGVLPEGLEIAAITEREDPRDAIVSKEPWSRWEDLDEGVKLATCSLRRRSQLLHLRPDITVCPIRGNLDTRLGKLHSKSLDGVVLAMAGIHRMNLRSSLNILPLEAETMLPAAGQGALGIEVRQGDRETGRIVNSLNDSRAALCIRSERACLFALGAECSTPIGVMARIKDGSIDLEGMVARIDGGRVVRARVSGGLENPEALGAHLAEKLIHLGAKDIIAEINVEELGKEEVL